MTSKLALYNRTLLLLGSEKLSSLSENREPRRVLDTIWDGGAIRHCLEQAGGTWASRSVRLDPSTTIAEPEFGPRYPYELPDDYVRMVAISGDEYFSNTLLGYNIEGSVVYSDIYQIYLKYISDDVDYGGDLGIWPESFCRYMESYMAFEGADRITGGKTKVDDMEELMRKRLADAQGKDGIGRPASMMQRGSWVRSRMNGSDSLDRRRR